MNQVQFPTKWTVKHLEDICEDIQPGFAQGKKDVKNGVIHLRMNNIGTNFEINFDLVRTIDATLEQLKKYKLEKDDIIFNNTNSSNLVGKSAIFKNSMICLYSNHLTRIRVKKQLVNPQWLLFYLRIMWLTGNFERMCNRWINQAAVNNNKIKNLEIPIPPLEEQKKIVQKLDYILSKIEAKKQRLFVIRTKFNNEVHLLPNQYKKYEIDKIIPLENHPKHWKIEKLKNVCDKITDGAHITPTYVSEGIPFLRVKDIHNNEIDWEKTKKIPVAEHLELTKRSKPEFGDVLFSKNGTIGISKVIDWKNEFSIFVSLALLKPKEELLNPYFLKYFLDSTHAIEQITRRSKTATVTNLHLEEIREINIPLPPFDEQKALVEKIKQKLMIAEAIQSRLKSLMKSEDKFKRAFETITPQILEQAFSGKLIN
jgi:type I restriction enzyme S subunit